jgi:hypothetical protein
VFLVLKSTSFVVVQSVLTWWRKRAARRVGIEGVAAGVGVVIGGVPHISVGGVVGSFDMLSRECVLAYVARLVVVGALSVLLAAWAAAWTIRRMTCLDLRRCLAENGVVLVTVMVVAEAEMMRTVLLLDCAECVDVDGFRSYECGQYGTRLWRRWYECER